MDASGGADATVIDEASIQEAMEDVGLTASDLNAADADVENEDELETEIVEATMEDDGTSDEMPDLREADLRRNEDASSSVGPDDSDSDDKDGAEEVMEGPEAVITDEEKVVAPKQEDEIRSVRDRTEESDVMDAAIGKKESDTIEDKEKDDENHNRSTSLGTPSLRRSSRTSRQPNSPAPPNEATPSSQGRTTRSQFNPDILAKQKSFMQKYQIAVKSPMEEYVRSAVSDGLEPKGAETGAVKRKWEDTGGDSAVSSNHTSPILEKRLKKTSSNSSKSSGASGGGHFLEYQEGGASTKHDAYCWSCHLPEGQLMECCHCPRSFHQRCVQQQSPINQTAKWACPECVSIRNAAKASRTSGTTDQLPTMLTYALTRIKSVTDSQPFFRPVDPAEFPRYSDYVIYPLDISQLEANVAKNKYATTRAFLAEFRWILHNCIIFNSFHSKLTNTARTLMKVCKHEMAEIDTCADCYVHAHTKRDTWFLEPCRRPHLLIWAKLKGFPHWPAKAMKANKEGNVDVRFFGAHDRAWVPVKDCYLYSQEMPLQVKNKRKANLDASIEEVRQHIDKLTDRYGPYQFPAARTAYNPHNEDEQLLQVLPGYKPQDEPSESPTRIKTGDSAAGDDADGESIDSESDREINDAETADDPPILSPQATPTQSPTPSRVASPAPASAPPTSTASSTPTPTTPVASTSPTPPAAPTLPEGDRSEDCNFLAMLQLAPRSTVETSTTSTSSSSTAPTSGHKVVSSADAQQIVANLGSSNVFKLQGKTYKVIRTSKLRVNSGETLAEAASRTESPGDKAVKVYVGSDKTPSRSTARLNTKNSSRRDADEEVKIKAEPQDENGPPPTMTKGSRASLGGASNISLAIDAVVGNYKEGVTPIPSGKSAKSKSSHLTKSGSKSRKQAVTDLEDDLDPAMYLDPTITITLVNNNGSDRKNPSKHALTVDDITAQGTISSSDLQALNALGENVSITVVPKRKGVPLSGTSGSGSLRSKENEEQSMVIEIDPACLQKNSRSTPIQAKARKSFPKSRNSSAAAQQQQIQQQKGSQAKGSGNSVPPMVSIPSRHLGSIDVGSRSATQQSTPARIPSITVRPVAQIAQPQPSIILQTGTSGASTEMSPIAAITALKSQPVTVSQPQMAPTATATTNSSNSTLTLNTMHTLGPDSAFGTGGLLLTFNRSLPAFTPTGTTSASATSATTPVLSAVKVADASAGPITAQLAAKTQQISDMVRQTLETLMQEASAAGNLEATVLQLRLDLERSRRAHQQEVSELKKSLETQQANADSEKQRALNELKRQMEADKKRAIDEAKKKQWCAQCGQEAIYYCCWNTAYCDHPCQQLHWQKHMTTCANVNQNANDSIASDDASALEASSPVASTPPTRILSPQKSMQSATVNGSAAHGKKANQSSSKASASAQSKNDSGGYTTISSPDVSVTLSAPNSNPTATAAVARIAQPNGSGAAQVTIPSATPITLLVATPTPSASDISGAESTPSSTTTTSESPVAAT